MLMQSAEKLFLRWQNLQSCVYFSFLELFYNKMHKISVLPSFLDPREALQGAIESGPFAALCG